KKLCLWSREAAPDGDAVWAQSRVIELETLLPHDVLSSPLDVASFADAIAVVFVRANVVLPGHKGVQRRFLLSHFFICELLHSSISNGLDS
ncbi:unnamed protein product, partial [Urochloa humidicola]